MEIFKLFGSIFIDNEKANKAIDDTDKKGKGLASSFGAVRDALGAVGLMAAGYLKGAIESAAKAEQTNARLKELTENQGQSWDKAKGKVDDFTKGIMKMSTYTGGEAKAALIELETRGVKLGDAMKMQNTLVDLAAGKNISLSEASGILADAYNGKTRALIGLGLATKEEIKQGISFNEVQKRINGRFNGAAASQLNTYAGQMQQFHNNLNSLKSTIGSYILPYFLQISKFLNEIAQKVNGMDSGTKKLIANVLGLTAVFGTLIGGAGLLQKILSVLGPTVTGLSATLKGMLGPVGLVVGAISLLTFAYKNNWGGIGDITRSALGKASAAYNTFMSDLKKGMSVGQAVYDGLKGILGEKVAGEISKVIDFVEFGIKGLIAFLKGDLAGAKNMFYYIFGEDDVQNSARAQKIVGTLSWVRNQILVVINFFKGQLAVVVAWVQQNMPLIMSTITIVMNSIKTTITIVLGWIVGFWQAHGDTILKVVRTVWDIIKITISTVLNVILGLIKTVMQIINGDWSGAWQTFVSTVKTLLSGLGKIILDGLSIIGTIFADLAKTAITWGENLIQGFIDGIKNVAHKVKEAAHDVMKSIKDFLGFNSPAKEGEGRFIVQWGSNMVGGFMDGIRSKLPQLQSLMNTAIKAPNFNSSVKSSAATSGSNNLRGGNTYNLTMHTGPATVGQREIQQTFRRMEVLAGV